MQTYEYAQTNLQYEGMKGGIRIIGLRRQMVGATQVIDFYQIYNENDSIQKQNYKSAIDMLTKSSNREGYGFGMPCRSDRDDSMNRPNWCTSVYY